MTRYMARLIQSDLFASESCATEEVFEVLNREMVNEGEEEEFSREEFVEGMAEMERRNYIMNTDGKIWKI